MQSLVKLGDLTYDGDTTFSVWSKILIHTHCWALFQNVTDIVSHTAVSINNFHIFRQLRFLLSLYS